VYAIEVLMISGAYAAPIALLDLRAVVEKKALSLKLPYPTTLHKAQGAALPKSHRVPCDWFQPGRLFIAFSCGRSRATNTGFFLNVVACGWLAAGVGAKFDRVVCDVRLAKLFAQ
jgi:hypothetical protein